MAKFEEQHVTPSAPPAAIRTASTILLLRNAPALEVLMVRRHQEVDFMSGAMVFPGGKVDHGDGDPARQDLVDGWSEVDAEERAPRIAAIREAFEETGILLGDDGALADADETITARKAIENGAARFIDHVARRGARLDLASLTLFSRWLTPPISPKRFDTYFYLALAPEGQSALFDGRETVETEWVEPSEALRLAAEGKRAIVFPTRMNLRLLAPSASVAEAVAAARLRAPRIVEPVVEERDGTRYLRLDAELGYGAVEEVLFMPTRPAVTP